VLDVEGWAELRREHFVRGVSIKELARRTGMSRNTIRAALRASAPSKYQRPAAPSKLDPFKDEIHRLLKADPRMPGQRIRELIAPLGYAGGKTIVDDYLRELRPLFDPPRTYQRTVCRPGEICQFDLWEPTAEIPVGHGQMRRGWVVVACLGYSRAGAGALIFSKEAPDLLFGIRRCLWSLAALPETLVWVRQSGLHAGGGRPTVDFAAFCGALKVDWFFCERGDPQAKGAVERLQEFIETSFEPGRVFANELVSRPAAGRSRTASNQRRRCCHSTSRRVTRGSRPVRDPGNLEASTLRRNSGAARIGRRYLVWVWLAARARVISVTTEAARSLSSWTWWVVQWRGLLSITHRVPRA